MRIKRGFLMFWIYSRCSRTGQTLETINGRRYLTRTIDGLDVLRHFSHFELLEAKEVFRFFADILYTVCDELDMADDGAFGE